jgi:hypothetical protein
VALLEDRLQQAAQRSSEAATRTSQLRTRVDGLRRDRLAYGELRAKQERSLRRAQRRMADLLGAVAESLDARHKARARPSFCPCEPTCGRVHCAGSCPRLRYPQS